MDLELIFKVWDVGLGFGIHLEIMGSGVGIWDLFSKIWDLGLEFVIY